MLEQAPIASLLWHPFGALGSCLVTVTSDACIRLWELKQASRHSFDEPALALDLKKLANATSSGEDFRASVYGTSKGFSPDSVEMEVAAACFGGVGSSDEHGWAPMTLWIAMKEGDVYALCPLLPSKWQPAASTIPSLSTSVVSKAAILDSDESSTEQERRTVTQQQKWLSDIDSQDSFFTSVPDTIDPVEIYDRPLHPASIPKLQGPFRLSPDPDFEEITDIIVMAAKVEQDTLLDEDEEESEDSHERAGLSVGIVCLLTQSGNVHVCLDMNGVEAQWLPTKRGMFQRPFAEPEEPNDLLLLESLDLTLDRGSASSYPMITPLIETRYVAQEPLYTCHPAGRYAFFITLASSTYICNLTPWLANLEEELAAPTDAGSSFRIGLLHDSERTEVSSVIKTSDEYSSSSGEAASACISIIDSDLGHLVLSLSGHQPYAATLDLPLNDNMLDSFAPDTAMLALPAPENREPYQPPQTFYASTAIQQFHDSLLQSGMTRLNRSELKSQVRLSPATLQVLTEAHRILSGETNRLGLAAADLFRRCQRMRAELGDQVAKMRDLASRIENVTSDGSEEVGDATSNGTSTNNKLDTRIEQARTRQSGLQSRVDALRRKVATTGGKEMSRREEAWSSEVKTIEESIGPDNDKDKTTASDGALTRTEDKESTRTEASSLQRRFDVVKTLAERLSSQAKEATSGTDGGGKTASADVEADDSKRISIASGGMGDLRRQKLAQVMQLLERETALVDAVTERLGRLGGLGAA